MTAKRATPGESDALWYKDAIIYELHLKAFCDGNADGIGDFPGLTSKLDYLRDLGVDTLWLLPFYPSPLRDDGYDIADYGDVHANYGTLRDLETFLREAHRRGLRVITELVLNHTSDQHPWFQRARRSAKGSTHRNFYVWSDDQTRYADARIIFKDFEVSNWTWDAVAGAFFWHRFYSHQPDLNYENPAVRKAMLQVVDFWLKLGVDGLRLDAVPYLCEREGTNCENLEETHRFLQTVRKHIDERFPNRMLLAEANQWPEDAVAYFGAGDECHMAFHFPVMPRLFMGIHQEDSFPIVDILEQTPALPETCQWALFLRNHDELTLEMVTDEERDYMYRVYATDPQARINLGIRRRLAPLLGNHRRKIELMNGLLLSLPGTPVLYYGDEIGMGDNIFLGDRNSVRTPMQWSTDRNAGFSRANPQRLYLPVVIDPEYHPEALNVEAQQNNPHSLLWWMKRVIALRKRFRAFGRGSIEFLHPGNRRVLAYLRSYGEEHILVVANLSRYVQFVDLDLSAFRGQVPVELFGNTEFPAVGAKPYFFTLGPHSFYWFALQPPTRAEGLAQDAAAPRPEIALSGSWNDGDLRAIESALPAYLRTCQWFLGKTRRMKSASIVESAAIAENGVDAIVAFVQVQYTDSGAADVYALPLSCTWGNAAAAIDANSPRSVVAHVRRGDSLGILHDATADPRFCDLLLNAIRRRRRYNARNGVVTAQPTRALRSVDDGAELDSSVLKGEQSNTSINFGDKMILKLFRRIEAGINPDVEIGRFLTERVSVVHTPPVAGVLTLERPGAPAATVGVLQGFVPNQGDAWRYTLSTLPSYFERAVLQVPSCKSVAGGLVERARNELPDSASQLIGAYLATANLLGERTAEFHRALASCSDDPAFAPEAFSTLYQRSLYQTMRNRARETLKALRQQLRRLPAATRRMAQALIDREGALDRRFRAILTRKLSASRIRCHGDYHLGRVLYTGKDVAIIDFEGEATRSLSERRIKRSPLRDVSGMLRSFHYAVYTAWADRGVGGIVRPEDRKNLEPAADFWYRCVSASFLRTYLAIAGNDTLLPRSDEELGLLLDVYMLEKSLYEIGYDLSQRPDWVHVPLRGALGLLDGEPVGEVA